MRLALVFYSSQGHAPWYRTARPYQFLRLIHMTVSHDSLRRPHVPHTTSPVFKINAGCLQLLGAPPPAPRRSEHGGNSSILAPRSDEENAVQLVASHIPRCRPASHHSASIKRLRGCRPAPAASLAPHSASVHSPRASRADDHARRLHHRSPLRRSTFTRAACAARPSACR